jgi:Fe-S cluster assembly protein SufD
MNMNVAHPRTKAESAYLEGFAPGAEGPKWLHDLRRSGYESFAASGLPHRRLEDWKWTDLRQIVDRAYPPGPRGAAPAGEIEALIARSPFRSLARARLVFVNGVFDESRSQLPASGDVEFQHLAGDGVPRWLQQTVAADGKDPIAALNAAFVSDGGALKVAAGATADAPIELLFVTTAGEPSTLTTRNVVVLEEGASATIIETHLGASEAYVANTVTEARLAKGSRLDRVKLVFDGLNAIHLANFHADVGEGATLRDFGLILGGRAVRQQGFVSLTGENADVGISGAYLLNGRQHADTRLVVDHAVPHGTSRELFKCVMDDQSRGVFQGKVSVRPGAQKTDGKQSSHALLLSEAAEFYAKPELEIYADDVVCGHGATSGELDDTMMFYLRSRGIPEVEAKSLLIAAFVGESFDTVDNEAIRDELTRMAAEWLVGRHRP